MHLPELPLGGGRLRRLGGVLSVRVRVRARRVSAEDDAKVSRRTLFPQLLDHRIGATAVVALEVAVFDQGDRRRFSAAHVIGRANWIFEQNGGCVGHERTPWGARGRS